MTCLGLGHRLAMEGPASRRTANTTDPHASLCLKFVAQAFDSMYARYLWHCTSVEGRKFLGAGAQHDFHKPT